MRAKLAKEWLGKDAFLVGGGSSLSGFNWSKLEHQQLIVINDAFRFLPRRKVLFGDSEWWNRNKWDLEKYSKDGGEVYSISPMTDYLNLPWLHQLSRISFGCSEIATTLAWNYNTGAAAINMALLLGASRVYLLGYDMARNAQGESHWHRHRKRVTTEASFLRFLRGFAQLAEGIRNKFPTAQIYNVTKGSRLNFFQKITFEEMEARLVTQNAA